MEEDNLDELVELIFSGEPKPKSSIEIGLEDQTADLQNQNRNIIFEVLSQVFVRGLEFLYKKKVVSNLSKQEFNRINEYLESISYKTNVFVNFDSMDPWECFANNIPITSYQLSFKRI